MLSKIKVEGVDLVILHGSTGEITKSDVELAKASNSIIIGFNIKPSKDVKNLANNQHVNIYFYDVIYHLNDDIQKIMKGKLGPTYIDEDIGEAKVQQIWKHSKIGNILGCLVINGEVNRNCNVRVIRDGAVIAKSKISSLKHIKEDIAKAKQGSECGITLASYQDLKIGDIIQCYKVIEKNEI
jgi:translation initiation factor IF-2